MPISEMAQVKVTDTLNRSSTMSAQLTVRQNDISQPKLTNLEKTNKASSIKITFQKSDDTYLTLVLINEQIIGFVDGETITFKSLPAEETDITLIPVSELGRRGLPLKTSISPLSPNMENHAVSNQPNTATPEPNIQALTPINSSNLPIIPRTPNTGIH